MGLRGGIGIQDVVGCDNQRAVGRALLRAGSVPLRSVLLDAVSHHSICVQCQSKMTMTACLALFSHCVNKRGWCDCVRVLCVLLNVPNGNVHSASSVCLWVIVYHAVTGDICASG